MEVVTKHKINPTRVGEDDDAEWTAFPAKGMWVRANYQDPLPMFRALAEAVGIESAQLLLSHHVSRGLTGASVDMYLADVATTQSSSSSWDLFDAVEIQSLDSQQKRSEALAAVITSSPEQLLVTGSLLDIVVTCPLFCQNKTGLVVFYHDGDDGDGNLVSTCDTLVPDGYTQLVMLYTESKSWYLMAVEIPVQDGEHVRLIVVEPSDIENMMTLKKCSHTIPSEL